MARKPRRKFRRYIRGEISQDFALGTLAGATLLSDINQDVLNEEAYITSAVLRWAMDNFTEATGDGPIMVGIAHSAYTDAEIEAWVENDSNWSSHDLVAQEVGRRKIKMVGIFDTSPAGLATGIAVLNDGKPIKTKLGWHVGTGQAIRYWAYNMGSSALATTDPNVFVAGHANIWPR